MEGEVLLPPPINLVEAPGTAPGSVTLISCSVYRHSRLPDEPNIPPGEVCGKGAGPSVSPARDLYGVRGRCALQEAATPAGRVRGLTRSRRVPSHPWSPAAPPALPARNFPLGASTPWKPIRREGGEPARPSV